MYLFLLFQYRLLYAVHYQYSNHHCRLCTKKQEQYMCIIFYIKNDVHTTTTTCIFEDIIIRRESTLQKQHKNRRFWCRFMMGRRSRYYIYIFIEYETLRRSIFLVMVQFLVDFFLFLDYGFFLFFTIIICLEDMKSKSGSVELSVPARSHTYSVILRKKITQV